MSCAVSMHAGGLCYELCSQFGPKVVPPKRIVKMLQDLLNHNDNNVRRLAKDLTVELCRWIGKDALKRSLFDNLKKQAVSAMGIVDKAGPAGEGGPAGGAGRAPEAGTAKLTPAPVHASSSRFMPTMK